jgi:hypothetical protein
MTPVLGGSCHNFVMTPTIRTHCFLRWGQTPVPTSESGRWLRTGGLLPLDTNRLETPSGDRRCRGLLLQDTQSLDVRGSFYWTPTGGAHPWVATTFWGSFHWTLGHLTYLFVSFSISQEFQGTTVNHHWRLPGFFKMVLGGGMYLCQTLGTRFEDCSVYTRVEYTKDWPGGCGFGWECSPTTLVA